MNRLQKLEKLIEDRKHFVQLHRRIPDHSGIVCLYLYDPDFALAHHIHAAIEAESPLSGRLIRIHRPPS